MNHLESITPKAWVEALEKFTLKTTDIYDEITPDDVDIYVGLKNNIVSLDVTESDSALPPGFEKISIEKIIEITKRIIPHCCKSDLRQIERALPILQQKSVSKNYSADFADLVQRVEASWEKDPVEEKKCDPEPQLMYGHVEDQIDTLLQKMCSKELRDILNRLETTSPSSPRVSDNDDIYNS